MITKKFGIDFHSEGGALTLPQSAVTFTGEESGKHSLMHSSGWTITAELHEDWFVWVNEFEAVHPKFGKVWGNFEAEVYADTEEGFQDFYKNHPPEAWDYWDI